MEKVKTKISTVREAKEFEVKEGQCLIISDPCYSDVGACIKGDFWKESYAECSC